MLERLFKFNKYIPQMNDLVPRSKHPVNPSTSTNVNSYPPRIVLQLVYIIHFQDLKFSAIKKKKCVGINTFRNYGYYSY